MIVYKKRTLEPLSVDYSSEVISGGKYKLTRVAAKRYEYFGLSYEQAMTLLSSKTAKYTRAYSMSVENGGELTVVVVPNLTSEIAIELEEGSKYKLTIAVLETDEKIAEVINFARTFEDENARDYDDGEGGEGFEVVRAVYHPARQSSRAYFEILILNHGDPRVFTVETKATATTLNWREVGTSPLVVSQYQQEYTSNPPLPGSIVRVRSGRDISEEIIVTEA